MLKLEKILKNPKVKSHLVDTLAAWTFFQPIRIFSELYVGGLETPEFIKSRLIGLATALTIAAPLTKLADKWERKVWKVTNPKQYARRFGAAMSYAIPIAATIYSAVLKSSGADWDEILKTVPTHLGISLPIAAIAYKKYIDYIRKKLGTTPEYLQ